MEVKVLASGSSGNCIGIKVEGGPSILIDAGLPKTKIERILLENGFDPTKISAIFVTHAHGDHIKGLPLANKYQIPVIASEGEWKDIAVVQESLRKTAKRSDAFYGNYGFFTANGLLIQPFQTHHDAYEPLGYVIEKDNYKVSVCLDTGHVDNNMLEAMAGSDVYVIESNHDPAMVDVSNYPASVKARVLSDIGHLSNEQCADALAKLVQGKGEKIFLTHLSDTNNAKFLAEATVVTALRCKGFEPGKHFSVEVV